MAARPATVLRLRLAWAAMERLRPVPMAQPLRMEHPPATARAAAAARRRGAAAAAARARGATRRRATAKPAAACLRGARSVALLQSEHIVLLGCVMCAGCDAACKRVGCVRYTAAKRALRVLGPAAPASVVLLGRQLEEAQVGAPAGERAACQRRARPQRRAQATKGSARATNAVRRANGANSRASAPRELLRADVQVRIRLRVRGVGRGAWAWERASAPSRNQGLRVCGAATPAGAQSSRARGARP